MRRKVSKAYCPIGVVEKNPCINWSRHIVFGKFGRMDIARRAEDGGDVYGSVFVIVMSR